ncbi:hypothetical protein INO77_16290, partial [Staphylococcus aureus]|nr:hypothetical protein [Staphylococcus aureus]
EDYVEKKEKEENSLKNKLIEFFAGYSLANNAAFNQSDFDFVSPFKVTVIFASSKSSVTSTVSELLCLKSNFK